MWPCNFASNFSPPQCPWMASTYCGLRRQQSNLILSDPSFTQFSSLRLSILFFWILQTYSTINLPINCCVLFSFFFGGCLSSAVIFHEIGDYSSKTWSTGASCCSLLRCTSWKDCSEQFTQKMFSVNLVAAESPPVPSVMVQSVCPLQHTSLCLQNVDDASVLKLSTALPVLLKVVGRKFRIARLLCRSRVRGNRWTCVSFRNRCQFCRIHCWWPVQIIPLVCALLASLVLVHSAECREAQDFQE